MATATLAPSTRQDWDSLIARHLKPTVGDIRIARLTARDCDRLAAAGLGPSRVRCTHVVLHRALAQAVRWGWLSRNPVSAAQHPEVPRTTVRPPSIDDVRAALAAAHAKDLEFSCWLQLAVATGARRGEVCALTWGEIDFDRRTVRIDKSVPERSGTTAASDRAERRYSVKRVAASPAL